MEISVLFQVFNVFLLFQVILALDRDLSCAGKIILLLESYIHQPFRTGLKST